MQERSVEVKKKWQEYRHIVYQVRNVTAGDGEAFARIEFLLPCKGKP